MKRNYQVEMALRNAALAEKLSVETLTMYDPELWRGPRLLVPVEIDALVVNPQEGDQTWANVRFRPEALEGYAKEKTDYFGGDVPPENLDDEDLSSSKGGRIPFDEFTGRNPGVYLHWSLPDGLTQAHTVSSSDEEDDTEGSDVEKEVEDTEISEDHEFPLIPDRWLVVRFYPGPQSTAKRRIKGWVIRAEEPDPSKRVVPLNQFSENRDQDNDRWLTAIGEGDPSYSAYYDNVENRLGFYDSLDDVAKGPVTYLISGWYSDKTDDPLYGPLTRDAWLDKLGELGWTLGKGREDDVRLAKAEEAAKKRWGQLGAIRAEDTSLTSEAYQDSTVSVSPPMNLAMADANRASGYTGAAPTGTSLSGSLDVMTTVQAKQMEYFHTEIQGLSMADARTWVLEDADFKRYWPRQVMCHAMTYSVPWNGRGGHYDGPDSGKPDPAVITVAVANTGIEALSALMAQTTGDHDAERIYNAYHYGMLPELRQQDGLALVESLLHAEDFESRPGGYVTEKIDQGDLFPSLSSRQANRVTHKDNPYARETKENIQTLKSAAEEKLTKKAPDVKREFRTSRNDITRVRDRMQWVDNQDLSGHVVNTRKSIGVRRAMPRYFEPKDPVLLFSRANRAYKHGEDAHRSSEDMLMCRISSETICTAKVTVGSVLVEAGAVGGNVFDDVSPSQIGETIPLNGYIPPDVRDLINETLLLDLDNASIAAAAFMAKKKNGTHATTFPANLYILDDLDEESFAKRYQVQMTIDKNMILNEELDAQVLAYFSGKEGLSPVEFAQKPWRKPWIPLHFDWEAEWLPGKNRKTDWSLGEHDYEAVSPVNEDGPNLLYQGTCLLTPGVTRTVHDRLTKFLEEETLETQDLASADQEYTLGDISKAMDKLDILSGSMSGFHDYLLGQVDDFRFIPHVDENGQPAKEKSLDDLEKEKRRLAHVPVYPVRSGFMKLTRLRLVDAFGQFVDIPPAIINNAVKAEDVNAGLDAPDCITMPPRINQPSRLMFRLVQADNDNGDATKNKSPICGWILPDHLDEALEVYDAKGDNLGQVQRSRPLSGSILASSLEWQGVPGNPGSFGKPPSLTNAHMRSMVKGLLAQGEQDALRAEEQGSVETALGAMLRMIDSTLWTVDPLGREGNEHLSVLVGRPLAVVRASLRLETMDLDEDSDLARMAFDVRLGDLTRMGDGLIGYFVNDDYSQFYPVHESIANETRPTRPHQGYLGAIQTVPQYVSSFSERAEPVTHPFINTAPFVSVRPVKPLKDEPASKSVMLTLLVDPRGGVHATSGILPKKKIELMREHIAPALEAMAITFRIGPILSDPTTIRMPLPAEIRGKWTWVRKTGLTVWDETAVVDAVPEPKLPPTPSQINEGWLKLSEFQSASRETVSDEKKG
ncbi:MAG: hypothetical protein KKD44_06470 [Proteobacteria bacterium]|nr:hypothetical protein [Pseudomonadota bacterium]